MNSVVATVTVAPRRRRRSVIPVSQLANMPAAIWVMASPVGVSR